MEEELNVYVIPDNFIDESRVLGGLIPTRNFIEAAVLAAVSFPVFGKIPASTPYARISIPVSLSLPVFIAGLLGISGDPLSAWAVKVLRWRRSGKLMLYNSHVKTAEPVKMKNRPERRRRRSKGQGMGIEEEGLVEGIDFVFEEDETTKDVARPPEDGRSELSLSGIGIDILEYLGDEA